jgi:hypothetical protein
VQGEIRQLVEVKLNVVQAPTVKQIEHEPLALEQVRNGSAKDEIPAKPLIDKDGLPYSE